MSIKCSISHVVATFILVSSATLSLGTTAQEGQIQAGPDPLPGVAEEDTNTVEIRLETSRVGPISADTPATMQALTAALPDLRIEEGEDFTEDRAYPVYRAYLGEDLLLTITPGDDQKVLSIDVSNPKVHNGLGAPVGSRFDEAYAEGDYAHCDPGIEELSGMLLCPAPSTANVVYLFSGTWNGPDGELPPKNQVSNWTLSLINWTPPTTD